MKTLAVLVFTFLCMASAVNLETTTFKIAQNGTLPDWIIQNNYDETFLRVRIDALEETSTRKFDWQSNVAVATVGTVNMTFGEKEVVEVTCLMFKCDSCKVTDKTESFGFNGSVDVFLFNEGGKYTFQGKTWEVETGSFKFNFEINDWKFAKTDAKLYQYLTVSEYETPKLQYSRILKEEKYGTFITEYPEKAIVDTQSKSVKLSTSSKNGQQKIEFPHFSQAIYYDPTVYTRNTNPVPIGYEELETPTMRVFYKPEYPDLYLLDLNKEVQGSLHVSITAMNETDNAQFTDWSKQKYLRQLGEEILSCKGKDTQKIQTLTYTCTACSTNKNPFVGAVKFYLINQTMKQCKFGKVEYQVDVKEGDVKMDVQLLKYNWLNEKNTLRLVISTVEEGLSKLNSLGKSREKADLQEFSASFAQEVVIFNLTDYTDNDAKDTKVETSKSVNTVDLQYFSSEQGLYYDPVFHRGESYASLLSFILFALFFLL